MRPTDPDLAVRRLGQRIAEVRVQRGWTQEQLADHAKVSTRYIQMVEGGEQNVSVKTAVRFANLLRVSLVELFQMPASQRPGRVAPKRRRRRAGRR